MLSDVHLVFVSGRIKCFNCQGWGHSYKSAPHSIYRWVLLIRAAAVVAKERTGMATTAATAVPQIADTMLLYNFFNFFFFHFKLLLPSVPFCHLEFMLQLK